MGGILILDTQHDVASYCGKKLRGVFPNGTSRLLVPADDYLSAEIGEDKTEGIESAYQDMARSLPSYL